MQFKSKHGRGVYIKYRKIRNKNAPIIKYTIKIHYVLD